jgi:hypothetical protein
MIKVFCDFCKKEINIKRDFMTIEIQSHVPCQPSKYYFHTECGRKLINKINDYAKNGGEG